MARAGKEKMKWGKDQSLQTYNALGRPEQKREQSNNRRKRKTMKETNKVKARKHKSRERAGNEKRKKQVWSTQQERQRNKWEEERENNRGERQNSQASFGLLFSFYLSGLMFSRLLQKPARTQKRGRRNSTKKRNGRSQNSLFIL